jgi:hypothetical protein
MTYINSLKSEAEHTDVQAKDPDFINLDWRELLLYFYMESKEHYKDITETKKNYRKHKKIETTMILHRHHQSSFT